MTPCTLNALVARALSSAALPVPPPEQHAPERPAESVPPRSDAVAWASFAGWLEALLRGRMGRDEQPLVEEIERRRRELTR